MNERILIVEDEASNRFLFKSILGSYSLAMAENGAQMWSLLDEFHPDLILLDVTLPGDDGLSLKAKLDTHPEYRDIPVIFVSGRDTSGDVVGALDLGARDYITKPFEETVLLARVQNVLRQHARVRKLKEESLTDSLTAIPNRRKAIAFLKEQISLRQRTSAEFSVAMLDIDHFKLVNDRYGHLAGDMVLVEFARIISKNARPYDCIARYGGEEFIMILLGTKQRDMYAVLRRIVDELASMKFQYEGFSFSVTFSAGVTDTAECDLNCTPETLIEQADTRLYQAKEQGRNRIITGED